MVYDKAGLVTVQAFLPDFQQPYPSKLCSVLINQPVIQINSNSAPGYHTKEICFIYIRTSALIAEIRVSVTVVAVRYGSLEHLNFRGALNSGGSRIFCQE